MNQKTVRKGTQFRYNYADGKPNWRVIENLGNGCYKCKVIDDADWGGTVKIFSKSEILGALNMMNFFEKARRESKNYADSLKEGDIVHIEACFGDWLEVCRVVDNVEGGKRGLEQIGLRAKTKNYKLGHWGNDGTWWWEHTVASTIDKRKFTLNWLNIIEHTGYRGNAKIEDYPVEVEIKRPRADNKQSQLNYERKTLAMVRKIAEKTENPAESIKAIKELLEEVAE